MIKKNDISKTREYPLTKTKTNLLIPNTMSKELKKTSDAPAVSKNIQQLLQSDVVKNRLQEILGNRSSTFATSVIQIAQSSELLKKAEPTSVLNAALVATTLGLPLNNSLGFVYIVPFNNKQKDGSYKTEAQLQMGYRSYIQLAQRSGQFKKINATDVRDGEMESNNRLSGEISFNWMSDTERAKKPIIGYVAYFELLNGYSHTLFMSKNHLEAHAKKYSQTFRNGSGLWKTDFDAMAKKTVLKLLLSKFAPLSVEMQRAVITDQAIVKDFDGNETIDVDYVDNNAETATTVISEDEQETQRLKEHLDTILSVDELDSLVESFPMLLPEQQELINNKRLELNGKNK